MSKTQKIVSAIQTAIQNGSGDWSAIVESVNSSGLKITNWMVVRNVLQGMINAGMIKRTPDIHSEIYVLTV